MNTGLEGAKTGRISTFRVVAQLLLNCEHQSSDLPEPMLAATNLEAYCRSCGTLFVDIILTQINHTCEAVLRAGGGKDRDDNGQSVFKARQWRTKNERAFQLFTSTFDERQLVCADLDTTHP